MYKILNSLSAVYLNQIANEDSKYGYDKKGNSLNPVDIEKKKRKDDDLAGAPNKKAKKDYDKDWGYDERGNSLNPKDKKKNIKKESFSNWRQDLIEIADYEQIPSSAKKRNEKISEKNVKNTVKINPEMKEAYGGKKKKHDCASKVKHEQFGVGDCISEAHDLDENGNVAHYDVEFEEYIVKNVPVGELEILEKHMHEHVIPEGVYEKQKTKEVMGALKKRDLKKDVKKKIAADIVKKKGDTSKSDDRYAYESKLWDEVAENLTQLGELNDADFRVEGYQRNPEADPRSARQRRMDDPDTGINSQAFRDFMAAQQRPAKKKPVAKKDSK